METNEQPERRRLGRRKTDISLYYRYKLLTESVSLGLFECDTDDHIEYLNPSLWKMFGSSEEEMCGLTWMDAMGVPAVDDQLWEAYKKRGESFSFDYQTVIDGEEKWFVVRIEPIEEEGLGAIGTVTDITMEKLLLKELRDLRSGLYKDDDDRNVATDQ